MGVIAICEHGYVLDSCRCPEQHDPVDVKVCPTGHYHGPSRYARADQVLPSVQPQTDTTGATTDPALLELLRDAGSRWGPLGVALAAASLTDPMVVISRLALAGRESRDQPDASGFA